LRHVLPHRLLFDQFDGLEGFVHVTDCQVVAEVEKGVGCVGVRLGHANEVAHDFGGEKL